MVLFSQKVNSPYHSNVNPEVQCIQEALAQFYSFFGNMQHLKAEIDMLDLDDVSRNRIMYQLDCIERELAGELPQQCSVDGLCDLHDQRGRLKVHVVFSC